MARLPSSASGDPRRLGPTPFQRVAIFYVRGSPRGPPMIGLAGMHACYNGGPARMAMPQRQVEARFGPIICGI
jgi:hypothetical protein